jgi:hypothetical protein
MMLMMASNEDHDRDVSPCSIHPHLRVFLILTVPLFKSAPWVCHRCIYEFVTPPLRNDPAPMKTVEALHKAFEQSHEPAAVSWLNLATQYTLTLFLTKQDYIVF